MFTWNASSLSFLSELLCWLFWGDGIMSGHKSMKYCVIDSPVSIYLRRMRAFVYSDCSSDVRNVRSRGHAGDIKTGAD